MVRCPLICISITSFTSHRLPSTRLSYETAARQTSEEVRSDEEAMLRLAAYDYQTEECDFIVLLYNSGPDTQRSRQIRQRLPVCDLSTHRATSHDGIAGTKRQPAQTFRGDVMSYLFVFNFHVLTDVYDGLSHARSRCISLLELYAWACAELASDMGERRLLHHQSSVVPPIEIEKHGHVVCSGSAGDLRSIAMSSVCGTLL